MECNEERRRCQELFKDFVLAMLGHIKANKDNLYIK
jgi:hypothetical protein